MCGAIVELRRATVPWPAPPQRRQRQLRMGPRVCKRQRSMSGHRSGARTEPRIGNRGLKTFDEQHAEWLGIGMNVLIVALDERHDGQHAAVTLVQILLQRLFDLGWEIGQAVAVPDRIAACRRLGRQSLQTTHQLGATLQHVDAADRQRAKRSAPTHDNADTIALQQSSAFVGDQVRGAVDVETRVHAQGKQLALLPRTLVAAQFRQFAATVKIADQLAQRGEDSQVSMNFGGRHVASANELDHARRAQARREWLKYASAIV